MSSEKSEAVVIRLADFSESSRVVTLFTRDFGKLSALAKGARRLKGPFEAALDLLARCRIVFLRKSSDALDLLTEAQLITRFRPFGRDLVNLYGGYYVAELLAGLTEDGDPHPLLYDEAVETLGRLGEMGDPRLWILRFEVVLLRELGQLPPFDACVVCGEPVQQAGTFTYWVSQGGVLCSRCRKEEFARTQIHAGTLAVLKKMSSEPAGSIRSLEVSEQQFKELRQLMTAAVSGILGRRPKMLTYLRF